MRRRFLLGRFSPHRLSLISLDLAVQPVRCRPFAAKDRHECRSSPGRPEAPADIFFSANPPTREENKVEENPCREAFPS